MRVLLDKPSEHTLRASTARDHSVIGELISGMAGGDQSAALARIEFRLVPTTLPRCINITFWWLTKLLIASKKIRQSSMQLHSSTIQRW